MRKAKNAWILLQRKRLANLLLEHVETLEMDGKTYIVGQSIDRHESDLLMHVGAVAAILTPRAVRSLQRVRTRPGFALLKRVCKSAGIPFTRTQLTPTVGPGMARFGQTAERPQTVSLFLVGDVAAEAKVMRDDTIRT
jgi:hypothetical protein